MPDATVQGNAEGLPKILWLDDKGLWEPGKGRDVEVVALDDARTALARSMPERRKYIVDRFGSLKAKSNRLGSRKGYCC
jgi:hypothetical protein